MTAPSPPAVRGACPTVDRPFHQVDGALLRVRVPGGVLSAAQAVGLAEASARAGDEVVLEITGRANLQLRGVPAEAVAEVAAAVAAAGLAEPLPCDLLAGPTAGLDPDEVVDVGPLLRAVARALAVDGMVEGGLLSPKFAVVLDGGGAVSLRGRPADLALLAVPVSVPVQGGGRRPGAAGAHRFELQLAGSGGGSGSGGSGGSGDSGDGVAGLVDPADAVAVVLAAAQLAAEHGGRIAALVEAAGGQGQAVRRIAGRAGVPIEPAAAAGAVPVEAVDPVRSDRPPLGVLPQGQTGLVAIGALAVLGRLRPDVLAAVADLARATAGAGAEVRLTRWRSLLVPGVPVDRAAGVVAALTALGLSCDPTDPAAGVVACAGSAGCPAGWADTQADGRRLVDRLRAAGSGPGPGVPATVHLSGCSKRCAAGRGSFDLTLEAGPDGYDLYRGDRWVAGALDPEAAVAAAGPGSRGREPVGDGRRPE